MNKKMINNDKYFIVFDTETNGLPICIPKKQHD